MYFRYGVYMVIKSSTSNEMLPGHQRHKSQLVFYSEIVLGEISKSNRFLTYSSK